MISVELLYVKYAPTAIKRSVSALKNSITTIITEPLFLWYSQDVFLFQAVGYSTHHPYYIKHKCPCLPGCLPVSALDTFIRECDCAYPVQLAAHSLCLCIIRTRVTSQPTHRQVLLDSQPQNKGKFHSSYSASLVYELTADWCIRVSHNIHWQIILESQPEHTNPTRVVSSQPQHKQRQAYSCRKHYTQSVGLKVEL
jgi:hypothetical protein